MLQDKEENEETMADKTVWKPLSTPLPDDAPTRIRVDWQELSEKNDDLAAWILIPAVDISYPVLQGEDNEYYLHRDINQESIPAVWKAGRLLSCCLAPSVMPTPWQTLSQG